MTIILKRTLICKNSLDGCPIVSFRNCFCNFHAAISEGLLDNRNVGEIEAAEQKNGRRREGGHIFLEVGQDDVSVDISQEDVDVFERPQSFGVTANQIDTGRIEGDILPGVFNCVGIDFNAGNLLCTKHIGEDGEDACSRSHI